MKLNIPDEQVQVGQAFVNKEDLTKEELKNIHLYHSAINAKDLGHRGNFSLIPTVEGFDIIHFKEGKRVKGDLQ